MGCQRKLSATAILLVVIAASITHADARCDMGSHSDSPSLQHQPGLTAAASPRHLPSPAPTCCSAPGKRLVLTARTDEKLETDPYPTPNPLVNLDRLGAGAWRTVQGQRGGVSKQLLDLRGRLDVLIGKLVALQQVKHPSFSQMLLGSDGWSCTAYLVARLRETTLGEWAVAVVSNRAELQALVTSKRCPFCYLDLC